MRYFEMNKGSLICFFTLNIFKEVLLVIYILVNEKLNQNLVTDGISFRLRHFETRAMNENQTLAVDLLLVGHEVGHRRDAADVAVLDFGHSTRFRHAREVKTFLA